MFAVLVLTASAVCANAAAPALPTGGVFYGAGSSAQFNTLALAAGNQIAGNALCGSNHWTKSNGAQLIDPRSGSILPELGNIWIVWDNSTAPTIVCYYVSVDSIVGMRAYFANATVHLLFPAGTADGNSVPFLGGTAVALPQAVINFVEGSTINFAATDIRPEDALFASNRTLTAYGAMMNGRGFTGVGYQGLAATPWLGVPIVSSVATTQANPVAYAWYYGDTDPITGAASRIHLELEIGAAPVLVLANTSNTASGHLGDPTLAITNINKRILNNVLLGNIDHIRDLSTVASGNLTTGDPALHVWIREPLSGTYNTMEFNVPNTNEQAGDFAQGPGRVTGQEAGINTLNTACAGLQTATGCPVESGNPLYHIFGANNSTRGRAIGTGQMITAVNTVADSIGYAFWGFSSFTTAKAGNLKYLTVDGVDPLFSTFNPNPAGTGALPQCTSTPCILPFDNIKNGSYPIWSKYRAVYDPTLGGLTVAPSIVYLAQLASTSVYSDLVPAPAMKVFRSHFNQVVTFNGGGVQAFNGLYNGIPETGGDMGGMVLTIQSEQDFNNDTGGNEQTQLKN
jgi:hypothetical protein